MTTYKVIQSIKSRDNAPVEILYYKGDNHAQAIAGLVSAAAYPTFYNVLSVRIEFS